MIKAKFAKDVIMSLISRSYLTVMLFMSVS
jgi:hypothetical protein